jgi:glycosyltransferase involved in cell wall biosynthesis
MPLGISDAYSAHSIVDFSNGASVATLDMLRALGQGSFECQAFCTAKLDFRTEVCFEDVIAATGEPQHVRPSICGSQRAQVLYTRHQRIPITVIRLDSTRHVPQRPDEVQKVLEFFGKFLEVNRPHVMLTYGGDPITIGMIAEAKRRKVPVVFALHNFAYTNPQFLANVDYCLVASEFARRHYRDKVGLDCQALSYPVDWDRVRVERREQRFATFVNPCLEKGVYPFARIAHELGRRRPDIPLLVVESRGTKENMGACGLDLAAAGNLRVMAHTTDPRQFWGLTKVALMPSDWWENQPLVAIEAMINGIPIIGSNRGGIPETVGRGGIVLPLPERLTPMTRIVPAAEEVEPWVEAIIRLWDDREFYDKLSSRALQEAQRWHPNRLRPLYADFFRSARHQPGAALIAPVQGSVQNGRLPDASSGAFRHKPSSDVVPLSFVVCVSDDALLKANLLASPGVTGAGSPHEVFTINGAPSAAAGFAMGRQKARHDCVVFVHQDVLLPAGWDRCLAQQLHEAERRFGPVGVAGVYGVGEVIASGDLTQPLAAQRIGWVVDRGRILRDGPELPAQVATLDELVLVVRRDTPLRFDPALGFHLYGADICLQAREQGLAVVALAAPCRPNSRSVGLPEAFYESAAIFARKWSHRLPVATPCVVIDRLGEVQLLGNATSDGPRSIARAVSSR